MEVQDRFYCPGRERWSNLRSNLCLRESRRTCDASVVALPVDASSRAPLLLASLLAHNLPSPRSLVRALRGGQTHGHASTQAARNNRNNMPAPQGAGAEALASGECPPRRRQNPPRIKLHKEKRTPWGSGSGNATARGVPQRVRDARGGRPCAGGAARGAV